MASMNVRPAVGLQALDLNGLLRPEINFEYVLKAITYFQVSLNDLLNEIWSILIIGEMFLFIMSLKYNI